MQRACAFSVLQAIQNELTGRKEYFSQQEIAEIVTLDHGHIVVDQASYRDAAAGKIVKAKNKTTEAISARASFFRGVKEFAAKNGLESLVLTGLEFDTDYSIYEDPKMRDATVSTNVEFMHFVSRTIEFGSLGKLRFNVRVTPGHEEELVSKLLTANANSTDASQHRHYQSTIRRGQRLKSRIEEPVDGDNLYHPDEKLTSPAKPM
ncbi:MAG: hypothetical protein Alpg2KO_31320 [Alphaproteobacteria bacterium]